MDKPSNLAFSDEATFRFFRGEILIPISIMTSVFVAVLIIDRPPLRELALPCGAMIAAWLGWVGLLSIIPWGHRLGEKKSISRMFAGEIWECWQFSAPEWQAQVEAVCNLISPRDEGLKAYVGAVYSSIFGMIIAAIMIAITFFAIKVPEVKTALRISAGLVFLLLVGIGLFQPMADRYKAERYRRKALQFAEPRVWFAPKDVYHEALGHTSLKGLIKVTDQTKSNQCIQFNCKIVTDDSDYLAKHRFTVPAGWEERAGRLVRRYRAERLIRF